MAQAKKGIKKKFFEIKAPLTSAKIMLYGSLAEEFVGRTIKLDLTRSLRGKNFELKLKVKLKEDALVAEPISLELIGSFVRRMMRRGADYIEDSFEVDCRDLKARIKPFLIARNKVSRAVRNSLRLTAKQYLEGYCKTRNAQEILSEIMTNKIQKDLSLKLKKTYPLALCEIRIFEIIEVSKKID